MSTLTMGVFVVWFPAVLIARRATRSERMNLSWRQVLAGCPPWMRGAAYGLLAYALLNFVLQLAGGSPAGGFSEARLASGHWMLFYGAAFCIFYSVMHKPDLQEPSQCPAGHEVGRDDAFCAQCGLPLNTGRQR
ncbi:hypothetical protein [Comamonas composti]|uniref:hypothetical protein n=1 Tax=Comamonas composti TaxID=408558 RepID=UPI001FE149E3|nr:hypothetical protein [Comamonas composti]